MSNDGDTVVVSDTGNQKIQVRILHNPSSIEYDSLLKTVVFVDYYI